MVEYNEDVVVVKKWSIFSSNNKLDVLPYFLDNFFFGELKEYEEKLLKWIYNNDYIICAMNNDLFEGAIKSISTNKYERNWFNRV